MSSEDVVIRVDGVSKRYELYDAHHDRLKQYVYPKLLRIIGRPTKQYFCEFWALKDISFEVKKGESIGIVGRNGSGKSTLLQIITGTLSPTVGTVSTHGRIAALLELGSGFNPEFSGRENVYLNGALIGLSQAKIDEKFDAIASFADIGQHLDQPVKTYSSGMLVRLAFAVQVQLEPDVLIVDEALAVGDALFQKRCFQKIDSFRTNGGTLLFVSHDQESVRTLTSRAMLLTEGSVSAIGSSSEVILEYRRQLNREESSYFSSIQKKISERSEVDEKLNREETLSQHDKKDEQKLAMTAGDKSIFKKFSFGDGGVKILRVELFNDQEVPNTVFYPRDRIRIRVQCISEIDTDKLNIAFRIRNKEGVKIFSWGTLNQDMQTMSGLRDGLAFWRRQVYAGELFSVWFECDCNLGVNLYEIQASVSYEESPDYTAQYILHWVDEAAFFQVLMKRDEYFFGGVVDLKATAHW